MILRCLHLVWLIIFPAILTACEREKAAQPQDPNVHRTETTLQTLRPLTVTDARRYTTFTMPDSANNVQFAFYHEWVAAEKFVRFEAPLKDCIAITNQIIREHNDKNPERTVPELTPITQVNGVSYSNELKINWFNPQNIEKGIEAGRSDSHCPHIWIDTENGIFYYQYTD